ncbi:MAG: hypothetical protein OEM32_04580 [Acidimicrobiia bacterium]|nr:hypothetical protein [Acidimicrobiia bacterium]
MSPGLYFFLRERENGRILVRDFITFWKNDPEIQRLEAQLLAMIDP